MLARLFSRHVGAEVVKGGIYWSHHDGGFVSVSREGGALPGEPGTPYTRTPTLAVLVAGPILGTAFALFLPAAAIVGLARILLSRTGSSRVASPAGRAVPSLDTDPADL